MHPRVGRLWFPILAILMVHLTPGLARAQLRIERVRTEIIPDPNFRYYFDLVLDEGTYIKGGLTSGDFFTVYDLEGLISGTNVQLNPNGRPLANWAGVYLDTGIYNLGFNPPDPPPPGFDSPAIRNFTWRFIAPDGEEIHVLPGQGKRIIGQFSIQAIVDQAPLSFRYSSRTRRRTGPGPNDFKFVSYYGIAYVPEPTSLGMLATGLISLAILRCRHHALRHRKIKDANLPGPRHLKPLG